MSELKRFFRCIKCGQRFANVPLVVISVEPFEASRVCWGCLEYCRDHGLKLQTLEEYEEQRGH